jgi:hypothetical protein
MGTIKTVPRRASLYSPSRYILPRTASFPTGINFTFRLDPLLRSSIRVIPELSWGENPMTNLYESDFYAWATEQASLLRSDRLSEADIEHIAEEIDSMGRSEKRELVSRLNVLLLHLLKWRYQEAFRGKGWRLSIMEQRRRLADHLDDNPSLKATLAQAIHDAYRLAIIGAARETDLDITSFPSPCPWSFDQMTNDAFWPED